MSASIIYRNALLYEAAMVGLYGRHYGARYRAVAGLIENGASVLDLCCGPAILYHRYLRLKGVRYTGLDLSEAFIRRLNDAQAEGLVWDVHTEQALPRADYVVMHASLFYFLPAAERVVDRMLQAARKQVIIAEPVRNLASSRSPIIAAFSRRLTDAGDGHSAQRFSEQTLASFFQPYTRNIVQAFSIPGKREKVYVLKPAHRDDE